MKKIIHVNQHVIRANGKSGDNAYFHEIEVKGGCKIVYSPDKPLSCGAKVWIETNGEVVGVLRKT